MPDGPVSGAMTAKPFSRQAYLRGVFVVEEASARDLPAVRALSDATLPEPYAPGFFDQLLEVAPGTFLVARDVGAGGLAGFAVAVHETEYEARLLLIATDPGRRKRGVGRQLLAEVERRLRRKGVQRVELEVKEDNMEAIRFYHRHAYEILETVPGFYQDGSRAIRMAKGI